MPNVSPHHPPATPPIDPPSAPAPLPYGQPSGAYDATRRFYRNPRITAVVALVWMAILPIPFFAINPLVRGQIPFASIFGASVVLFLILAGISIRCRARLRRLKVRTWACAEIAIVLGMIWILLFVRASFLGSSNSSAASNFLGNVLSRINASWQELEERTGLAPPLVSRPTSNRVKSGANLHSMGASIVQYSSDNRGHLPDTVEQLIIAEQLPTAILICPGTTDTPVSAHLTEAQMHAAFAEGGHNSYIYVGKGLTGADPGNSVVFYEPLSNFPGVGGSVLFLNGDVIWYPTAKLSIIIKQLDAGQNPPPVLGPPTGPPSWQTMLSAPSTAPAAAPATHPSTAPARAPR